MRAIKKEERHVCCLCGKSYVGYGNNAWPLDNYGRCCDECNATKVIPARLADMQAAKVLESFSTEKTKEENIRTLGIFKQTGLVSTDLYEYIIDNYDRLMRKDG